MKWTLLILTLSLAIGCTTGMPTHKQIGGKTRIYTPHRFIGITYRTTVEVVAAETVKQAKSRLLIENMERDAHWKARQHVIAWFLKMGAIVGFIVGGFIHLKSTGGVGKSIGSSVMAVAGAAYVAGVVMHWEADHDKVTEWIIMGCFFLFGVYLVWRWRNEDGTKLKAKSPLSEPLKDAVDTLKEANELSNARVGELVKSEQLNEVDGAYRCPKCLKVATGMKPEQRLRFCQCGAEWPAEESGKLFWTACPACFDGKVIWREGQEAPEACESCMDKLV